MPTTLTELQDLLAAHAINDVSDIDAWEININPAVTRVTGATTAIHVNRDDAFAAATGLVDQILELGYKLVRAQSISATSPQFSDSDAVTYRGLINIVIQPSTS